MKILILGGDKRYDYIYQYLKNNNEVLHINHENLHRLNNIKKYDLIIFPMNGLTINNEIITTKGKIILNNKLYSQISKNALVYTGLKTINLKEKINEKQIISFLDDNCVNRENNILTAQGIKEKIEGKKICILGYGNIAKLLEIFLYDKYLLFGVKEVVDKIILGDISFYTSDIEKMNHIFKYSDYIINTAPENIITKESLEDVKAKILDIASSPYGASEEVRNNYINYEIYSSIPAKYDYEKAGEILIKKLKKDLGGSL